MDTKKTPLGEQSSAPINQARREPMDNQARRERMERRERRGNRIVGEPKAAQEPVRPSITPPHVDFKTKLLEGVESHDAREELEILCDDLTEYGRGINEEQLTGVMRGLHSAEYTEHAGHIDLDDLWIKVYWVFDHLEGLGFTRESLEKLWRKVYPGFMAGRAELEAALAKSKKPAKPKDDRPAIYRKIDKALADMPATIDALSLNTTINRLFLTGDLDRNAQRELAKGIASKTNLTIHDANREIKKSIDDTKRANGKDKKRNKNAKPEIPTDTGLNKASEMAYKIMTNQGDDPVLFHNGGRLVDIHEDENGAIRMEEVYKDRFKGYVDTQIIWTKDDVDVGSKPNVANAIALKPKKGYPPVHRLTNAPVYTADKMLVMDPGYHAESGLYYAPAPGVTIPPVSAVPTQSEVTAARDGLVDLMGDFPLGGMTRDEMGAAVGGGEPVPAVCHALSVALTPIVRDMIEGPTPNHLARKDKPRTGATKLMLNMGYIGTLKHPAAQTLPSQKEEVQKTIMANLDSGAGYVFFDNLAAGRENESDELAAAVTAYPTYTGRRLGQTQMIDATVKQTWLSSGNRTQLSPQLAERTLLIDLDPKMENPGDRPTSSFKYNLDRHVPANAGKYMHALLTLVQNWIAKGCPEWKGQALGGFESHAKVIGGILDAAGVHGFMQNREKLKAVVETESPENTLMDALILAHHEGRDTTVFRAASDAPVSKMYKGDSGELVPCPYTGSRVVSIRDVLNDCKPNLSGWGYAKDEEGNVFYPSSADRKIAQQIASMVGTVRKWDATQTEVPDQEGRYVLTKVRKDKGGVFYRFECLERVN